MNRHLLVVMLVGLLLPSVAFAQDSDKIWIDVNFGGATPAEDQYVATLRTPSFGETATFAATYSFPRGASFDVGADTC